MTNDQEAGWLLRHCQPQPAREEDEGGWRPSVILTWTLLQLQPWRKVSV